MRLRVAHFLACLQHPPGLNKTACRVTETCVEHLQLWASLARRSAVRFMRVAAGSHHLAFALTANLCVTLKLMQAQTCAHRSNTPNTFSGVAWWRYTVRAAEIEPLLLSPNGKEEAIFGRFAPLFPRPAGARVVAPCSRSAARRSKGACAALALLCGWCWCGGGGTCTHVCVCVLVRAGCCRAEHSRPEA